MLMTAIVLASLFASPVMTSTEMWDEYKATIDGFNARVEVRKEALDKLKDSPDDCINAFSKQQEVPKSLVTEQMWAIAEVYELYGDDNMPKRFEDKRDEAEKTLIKLFADFDKCVAKFAAHAKET